MFKQILFNIIFYALKLLYSTYRIEENNKIIGENLKNKSQKYIFASWHEQLLFFSFHLTNSNIATLVSLSKDGDIIASMLQRNNIFTARGSSSHASVRGFMSVIKAFKKGYSVFITPDGPRGPAKEVQHGVARLSKLLDQEVIPVSIEVDREWRFNSWDQMRLAKPFAKIKIHFWAPVQLNQKNKTDQELVNLLEQYMK